MVTSSFGLFHREKQQYSTGLKFYTLPWILTAIDSQQVSVVNQPVSLLSIVNLSKSDNSSAFISIKGFHLYLKAWSLPECGLNTATPSSPDGCAVSEGIIFGDLTLFESTDKRSAEKCQTNGNKGHGLSLSSISATADKYLWLSRKTSVWQIQPFRRPFEVS